MVAAGDPAPDFTLTSAGGEPVTLSSLRGNPVVVFFYPKDDTPGCTAQACGLRDSWTRMAETGVEVFGVSPDSVRSHARFREKYGLPYRLLADEGRALHEVQVVADQHQRARAQARVQAAGGVRLHQYLDTPGRQRADRTQHRVSVARLVGVLAPGQDDHRRFANEAVAQQRLVAADGQRRERGQVGIGHVGGVCQLVGERRPTGAEEHGDGRRGAQPLLQSCCRYRYWVVVHELLTALRAPDQASRHGTGSAGP